MPRVARASAMVVSCQGDKAFSLLTALGTQPGGGATPSTPPGFGGVQCGCGGVQWDDVGHGRVR